MIFFKIREKINEYQKISKQCCRAPSFPRLFLVSSFFPEILKISSFFPSFFEKKFNTELKKKNENNEN